MTCNIILYDDMICDGHLKDECVPKMGILVGLSPPNNAYRKAPVLFPKGDQTAERAPKCTPRQMK